MRRLPGPAVDRLGEEGNFRCHIRFVSGLAENTNLIFCADSSESQTANGCPVLRGAGTISREATVRERRSRPQSIARSPERAQKACAFLLTLTYIDGGDAGGTSSRPAIALGGIVWDGTQRAPWPARSARAASAFPMVPDSPTVQSFLNRT